MGRRLAVVAVALASAGCLTKPPAPGQASDGGNDSGGMFDEDRDGIPDNLDLCIVTPSGGATQADQDGDGVGDQCDSHKSLPGDFVASRELFDGATTSWTLSETQAWQIEDGGLVTVGDPDSTDAYITLTIDPGSAPRIANNATILTRFTVVDFGTVTDGDALEVSATYPGQYGRCRPNRIDPPDTGGLGHAQVVDVNTSANPALDTPIGVNESTPVTLVVDSEESDFVTCTVGSFSAPLSAGMGSIGPLAAKIRVTGMRVRLEYIVIYGYDPQS